MLGVNRVKKIRLPAFADKENKVRKEKKEYDTNDNDVHPDKIHTLGVCSTHGYLLFGLWYTKLRPESCRPHVKNIHKP